MTERVDFLVIGLGAMGSAAVYQLARRGAKTLGVDSHTPPHALGSSHGETRVTRQAVGEGSEYVPLVLDSHRIWRELESETGENLFNACGVLLMARATGEAVHHGKPDFLARTSGIAREFQIPHEILDARQIGSRFPQFLNLVGDEQAYYEPGGGYVFPERCIGAQLKCAARLGAEIRTNLEVVSIEQRGGCVEVATSQGTIEADRVIVAAGGWAGPLLGDPFDRLLKVKRQVLHWFELEDSSAYRAAPVFVWMHGSTNTDYFYGFPPLPGDHCIKVATEQYEKDTTADAADREVDPTESSEMYERHVKGRLAGVTTRAAKAAACLYTVTPDSGFIIDRHPRQDRVFVVSACSGHGFKHSAAIGAAIAELMIEGNSRIDLTPFSIARFP